MLLGISLKPFYPVEMNLGKRLKQAREARGWGQEDLAEKVPGANQPMISALETRDSETSTLLFGFADALRVNPRWLQDAVGESGLDVPLSESTSKSGPEREQPEWDESALLLAYRNMSPGNQMTVRNVVHAITRGGARDLMAETKWEGEERRGRKFHN